MTEDVLEQVVDDWLRRYGYFTRTNVRFGPQAGDEGYDSKSHNQQSDIDVVAVKPTAEEGPDRVWAISCKAMQVGFSPNRWLAAAEADKVYNGKNARKHLRELWDPVWAKSLQTRVADRPVDLHLRARSHQVGWGTAGWQTRASGMTIRSLARTSGRSPAGC